ncbi:hypothetical protein HUO09_17575 [Vibrio sp. Y2-5]|uniref:hypothetical protein n=1 Tax=Vibrio sp. Y2-5 TaxID=2743977 RepID=UPI0016605D75|nr:hypothetical protein [Vibrio sp. Y2-5]MBD0788168.1 hypothetical protein [Vibrio sp. Y2-5]
MKKSTWLLLGSSAFGSPILFDYVTFDSNPFGFAILFIIMIVLALIGGYYWFNGDTAEI